MERFEGEENETFTLCTTSISSSRVDPDHGRNPGDGVCHLSPPSASLQAVLRSAYDIWATIATQTALYGRDGLFDIDVFLQLMTKSPSFRPPHLEETIAPETLPPDLIVDLDMCLETCVLLDCEQSVRRIPFPIIGHSIWNVCEVVCAGHQEITSQLGLPLPSLQSLTRLVLARSCVFCCRWGEILQISSENVALF